MSPRPCIFGSDFHHLWYQSLCRRFDVQLQGFTGPLEALSITPFFGLELIRYTPSQGYFRRFHRSFLLLFSAFLFAPPPPKALRNPFWLDDNGCTIGFSRRTCASTKCHETLSGKRVHVSPYQPCRRHAIVMSFQGALFGLTPALKDGEYFAGDGGVLFMPFRFKHRYNGPRLQHASKLLRGSAQWISCLCR